MKSGRRISLVIATLAMTLSASIVRAATPVEELRKELLHLPYYGVFDFLAFSVDKAGVVTLTGQAYQPTLKRDAERAAKKVVGVKEVGNRIEQLPVSQADDDLRWLVYDAIYRDPALAHYAPGRAMLGTSAGQDDALGLQSTDFTGAYPIHIIVSGMRITLKGLVNNEGDKNLAGQKAHVPGALAVDNQLTVKKGTGRP